MMKSFQHLYQDALLRRLIGSFDELSDIQSRIDLANAGIVGEDRVKMAFDDCLRDDEILMQNLQFVSDSSYSHQLDFVLLTTHFLLLVEVKNISGTLYYDAELRQFTCKKFNGDIKTYRNPFDQILRHHEFLYYFLKNAHVHLPIHALIINANANSTLDQSFHGQPIIHLSALRNTLNELKSRYPKVTSKQMLVKLRDFLESKTVFLEGYRDVKKESLKRGVLCPSCNFSSVMQYVNRTWHCYSCGKNNRYALKLALKDYRILIGPEITNRQFRDWTGLEDVYAASKILRYFKFPSTGLKRGRVYTIPQEYMFLDE